MALAAAEQTAGASGLLQRLPAPLRNSPLVALLIAGAASVALVAAVFLWTRAPEYRVLYSNLSEADGGRIITELDARQVPYRFSQGGQAILVPADRVHSLRLQMAEQGLPRGGNIGFELMDDQAFGISQFAERLNFQRGLEGELSRSIESLGPVERARVHIAMPQESVFVRDREPAKASVVLTLYAGRVLTEGQVSAIRHLVASSVPELSADQVTVVNQRGQMLTQDSTNPNDPNGQQLVYRNEIETNYQRRIENILVPIFGANRVRAQVAAQIDFSRREETSERFGPNQQPNQAAVRSLQTNLSYNGNEDLPGGIPGALSNTPPGVAASPIADPAAADDANADGQGDDEQEGDNAQDGADGGNQQETTNSLTRDDVINYEVDRNVAHVRHQNGRIERISAAVVVDYRQERDEAGEWQQIPLTEDELLQVERLAKQAIGFSAKRGDTIEVVNSPFTQDDGRPAVVWWKDPELIRMTQTIGEPFLLLLMVLLVYLLLLRPFIRHYTRETTPAQGQLHATVGGDEDEDAEGEEGKSEEDIVYEKKRRNKALSYQQKLGELRALAQTDPRMVALIARGWMKST